MNKGDAVNEAQIRIVSGDVSTTGALWGESTDDNLLDAERSAVHPHPEFTQLLEKNRMKLQRRALIVRPHGLELSWQQNDPCWESNYRRHVCNGAAARAGGLPISLKGIREISFHSGAALTSPDCTAACGYQADPE